MRICSACGECYDDAFDLCAVDGSPLEQFLVGSRTLGDRYQLEQRLEAGAMGVVFRSTHLEVGSTVAVKLMLPAHELAPIALTRFRREAQILGQIKHPNAVLVMDFGVERRHTTEIPYLVMEYLRGESLTRYLRRKPRLTLADAERIVTPVCEAVDEAHQAGIVHRDIKPSNVFLERLRDGSVIVKVLDFGIAKLVEHGDVARAPGPVELRPPLERLEPAPVEMDDEATEVLSAAERTERDVLAPTFDPLERHALLSEAQTSKPAPISLSEVRRGDAAEHGHIIGTISYMAPEQVSSMAISPQADIYAVATLIYRLLTGRMPFPGDLQATLAAKANGQRPSIRDAAEIPASLLPLLERAFSPEPEERPARVTELARALREASLLAASRERVQPLVVVLSPLAQALVGLSRHLDEFSKNVDQPEAYTSIRDRLLAVDGPLSRARLAIASPGTYDALDGEIVAREARALEVAMLQVLTQVRKVSSTNSYALSPYLAYLTVLCTRLNASVSALVRDLNARAPDARSKPEGQQVIATVFDDDEDAVSRAELETVAEGMHSKDPIDRVDALDALLDAGAQRLLAHLARGASPQDQLTERLLTGIWEQVDRVLLSELHGVSRVRILPTLARLGHVPAARPFSLLARLFRIPVETDEQLAGLIAEIARRPEPEQRLLWRCLLFSHSPRVRRAAVDRLRNADFWVTISNPHTSIALVRMIFERVRTTAVSEYLKVFFFCVRERVRGAAQRPEEVPDAFLLLELFFQVPCYHEDLIFEPLLSLEQELRNACFELGFERAVPESVEALVGRFRAAGVVESIAPAEMRDIPLPIQRKLAREGHFIHYFVAHPNARVAAETIPHLLAREEITPVLKIKQIHRCVITELAKEGRFFRTEEARLALLFNPKTPVHVARKFLPFINRAALKQLAASKDIGMEVRRLATGQLKKLPTL